MRIARGIFPGTDGNETLSSPVLFRSIVTGALKPREVENTLAIWVKLELLLASSIRIRFGAKSSCVTKTRSEPLIMK